MARHHGLLQLSRELHEAASLSEVMDRVLDTIAEHTRYERAWLLLPMSLTRGLEVVGYAVAERVLVEERMATIDLVADRYIHQAFTSREPFVIDDLRTYPLADQRQVEIFGNRTVINVPMLRVGERIGVFVVGTFAAEGVLPPTEEELELIVQVASLVSVVAGRLRAEAAQRSLEQSVQSAQRLEALGRMAGEISHDFNNILLAIIGNTHLALTRLAGHPAERYLSEVKLAADRAADLSRQLLAFSSGQPMSKQDLDVAEVVQSIAPVLRSLLPSSIELRVVVQGDASAAADASQVEQVVMNLVINARDAMPRGGVVTVDVSRIYAAPEQYDHMGGRPGHFVVIAVSDTGVGIAPELAGRVFEPFFTTKQPGRGTGLGLAAVESIARRHDGFVRVTSEVGRGTTFHVYVPALDGVVVRLAPRDEPKGYGGSESVLVVDDDPQVRRMLDGILSSAGYRVLVAEHGRAALDVLDGGAVVDLVVSDLVMPHVDGPELAERLGRRPSAPPIILMTGYAPDASALVAEYPMLEKPFSPGDLLRKIRETLDARSATARRDRTGGGQGG